MAQKEGLKLVNAFTRGLITEVTSINYPDNSASETYNCVFDHKGRVTRRPSFDIEEGYTLNTYTPLTDGVVVEFNWDAIKSFSEGAFLVQQMGNLIYFFSLHDNVTPSANINSTVIDLDDYALPGKSPGLYPCQFTQSNGNLLVVNRYIDPILVTYNQSTDSFTISDITLQYRDFVGLDDGLGLTEQPTINSATLVSDYPEHLYNLVNQGWYKDNALDTWDTESNTMPSNADAIAYYRFANNNIFTALSIQNNKPGNSPAPKGHFILNVGEDDRQQAMIDDTTSLASYAATVILPGVGGTAVDPSEASIFGNATTNQSNAFNGNTAQASGSCATRASSDMYLGLSFTDDTKITRATVCASNNQGFLLGATNYTIELYAKATSPASSTDGTLLGTATGTDANSIQVDITCTNMRTAYKYWWVRVYDSGATATNVYVAEVILYRQGSAQERPQVVAFFAGRAWYAGIDDPDLGSKIYFSQVIESDDNYGKCYQSNDPASEKFADLLATDGGVITIPDINQVRAMFTFQGQLLILATNGVWLVTGGGGGVFSATDYRVRKISSIGSDSPMSVVDVKGLPIWWAEDGLYTVEYDANYDSTVVKNLTEDTIKSFVLNIPTINRKYVKGTFDKIANTVYWLYTEEDSYTSDYYYKYNRVLCLNTKSGAFYPWTITRSTATPQYIRGLLYISDGAKELPTRVVYTTTYSTNKLTYSTVLDEVYTDWLRYDTAISGDNDEDYESYFITGHELDGNSQMTDFQSKYILTYMDTIEDSSVRMQGLFNFTTNGNSGKWSTSQQAYNSLTTRGRGNYDVKTSRLLVRGKGQSLRVKYRSESGKPFSIIGWGLYLQGNEKL